MDAISYLPDQPATAFRTKRGFFDVLDPDPAAIVLHDIARSLSRTPRFLGHTEQTYTVAQHCVLLAMRLPEELRFVGLMHDAPEAYTGDIIRPMKVAIGPRMKEIEDRIWQAFCLKYDMAFDLPEAVKIADNRMLATEYRDLFDPAQTCAWEPYEFKIHVWNEHTAKATWLKHFKQYKPRGVLG